MDWKHWGLGVVAGATALTAFAPTATADLNTDPIPHNGLSSDSLNHNALTTNPRALQILQRRPLDSSLFKDEYMRLQLHDSRARDVMTELVRCALGPRQSLMYRDPIDNQTY